MIYELSESDFFFDWILTIQVESDRSHHGPAVWKPKLFDELFLEILFQWCHSMLYYVWAIIEVTMIHHLEYMNVENVGNTNRSQRRET